MVSRKSQDGGLCGRLLMCVLATAYILSDFIEENWERFWKRPSNVSWRGSVSACLNASTNRFRSLSEGLFALDTLEPAHKQCEQRLLLGQKRVAVCQIAEDGSLIEIVGEAASTSLEMKSRKRRAGDNVTTTAPLDGGEMDVFDNLPDVDFKKKKKSMKFADENLDPATAISTCLTISIYTFLLF